jgi:hypothetical protein
MSFDFRIFSFLNITPLAPLEGGQESGRKTAKTSEVF